MPATLNDLELTMLTIAAQRELERAIEAIRRGDEFTAFMALGNVEAAAEGAQRRLNRIKFVNALTKEGS